MNNLSLKILLPLRTLSNWFRNLLQALSDNILSVIVILLFHLLSWYFDQVQDLLLILNQRDHWYSIAQVPLYFFSLFMIANIIWNAPKYLNRWNSKQMSFKNFLFFIPDYHYKKIEETQKDNFKKANRIHMQIILPRILGFLFLTTSALSILKAIQDYQITTSLNFLNPTIILIISLLISFILLGRKTYIKLKSILYSLPYKKTLLVGILIISFSVIIYLGIINKQNRQDLILLFYAHSLLNVLFVLFSFSRKELLTKKSQIKTYYSFSMISTILCIFFFIILNIFTDLAMSVNPISIVTISIVSYLSISSFVILMGKLYRISFFSYLIFGLIGLSIWNQKRTSFKHYSIETIQVKKPINRPFIDDYIDQWIEEHYKKIINPERSQSYPIIFVSSQGGGSKGGLWSSLIQGYLHTKTQGTYFSDHLFSMTGASGGSVGNALYFTNALQNNIDPYFINPDHDIKTLFGQFYRNNFLSSPLTSFLGSDLIQSSFGISFSRNRDELLEKEWEETYKKVFKPTRNTLNSDFLKFYQNTKTTLPLLMINTTHVQTGQYATISPVSVNFKGIQDFYQVLEHFKNDSTSIKLSTALSLGSSFPIISSAEELKGYGQYVDAGYYDNIGGVISKNINQRFKERLQIYFKDKFPKNYDTIIKEKIDLVHLVLINSPYNLSENGTIESDYQFKTPLTTLTNTRTAHTYEQQQNMENRIEIKLKTIPVYITKDAIEVTPALPLGRYLSKIAVQSIENNLTKNQTLINQLDKLAQQMNATK